MQAEPPGAPFGYDIHLRIAKLFRIGFKKLGLCGRAGNGQHAEQNGQPLRDLPRHKMSRMKGLTLVFGKLKPIRSSVLLAVDRSIG